MIIKPSTRKDKRFMAIFDDKNKVHFGLKDGETYIDHHDKKKREDYIKRHQVNEDWSNPYSAGALSRYLLWGKSTDLNTNINKFKSMYNIK
jgi:hypothetical protein